MKNTRLKITIGASVLVPIAFIFLWARTQDVATLFAATTIPLLAVVHMARWVFYPETYDREVRK